MKSPRPCARFLLTLPLALLAFESTFARPANRARPLLSWNNLLPLSTCLHAVRRVLLSLLSSPVPPLLPAAARSLLQALGELEDPQVGLRLLRFCAGHCKLTHSIRTPPLFSNTAALQEFDTLVRECFCGLTGLHLTDLQWEQAARGLAHSGLGLRSVVRDAAAAYLASVGACAPACRELDQGYAPNGLASEPVVCLAATSFSAGLEQPLATHLALGMKQKGLSALSDAASCLCLLSQPALSCVPRLSRARVRGLPPSYSHGERCVCHGASTAPGGGRRSVPQM